MSLNFFSLNFIKNIVSSTSSYLLKFGVNFFITNEVIKYLGFTNFGIFSYLVSVAAIVGSFGSLGYESIISRIIKSFDGDNKSYISIVKNAFTSVFFVGIVISIFFSLVVFFFDREYINLAIVYSLSFPFASYNVFRYYFEFKLKIRLISWINNFVLVGSSIFKIIVIYFDLGLSSFILASLLEPLLLFLSYRFLIKRESSDFKLLFEFDWSILKFLLKQSYPFLISSMLIIFYMKFDQVLLKHIMGSNELGIFSSTIRLVELFYFVPVIFQTTYNGHFLQTLDDNRISQKKMFSITLIVFYISVLVFIFFLLFSSTVLRIIYGNMDTQNALLLNLYSICFIMVSMGTIRNIRINSIGASKFYMLITFFGVLLNVSSNLIFIPRYGIMGCAISTIISQFFVSILSSFFHPILREDLIFFLRNVFNFKQYKNHFNLN